MTRMVLAVLFVGTLPKRGSIFLFKNVLIIIITMFNNISLKWGGSAIGGEIICRLDLLISSIRRDHTFLFAPTVF